jgi:exodeoxyribonuclease VII large subunit
VNAHALPDGLTIRSVGEFTEGLDKWFKRQPAFKNAAIAGEISGLKAITGGHITFTLKDRGGVLDCICWQSKVANLPQLSDGIALIAVGNVQLRRDRGSYQLVVDAAYLSGGTGELFAQLEALRERFRNEGLFADERKRVIPRFVKRVALVSAGGSKASEDFLQTMRVKAPFVEVTFIKTRVQGAGAEIDIAAALDEASRLGVDAIVLTRGGGSFEDLFAFNLEPVVRAIIRSKAPVITAIGHQEDHHLADDAADATFGTPSKAAESLAEPWVAVRDRLAVARRDLERAIRNAVGTRAQVVHARMTSLDAMLHARLGAFNRRFADLERRLNAQNPQARIGRRAQILAGLRGRLDAAGRHTTDAAAHAVALAIARLASVDPGQPLKRGYAMVLRDGKLVRSARDVAAGDIIEARLAHGTLDARVEATHDD